MKISEVITALAREQIVHGDVEVVLDYSVLGDPVQIVFDKRHNCVIL